MLPRELHFQYCWSPPLSRRQPVRGKSFSLLYHPSESRLFEHIFYHEYFLGLNITQILNPKDGEKNNRTDEIVTFITFLRIQLNSLSFRFPLLKFRHCDESKHLRSLRISIPKLRQRIKIKWGTERERRGVGRDMWTEIVFPRRLQLFGTTS